MRYGQQKPLITISIRLLPPIFTLLLFVPNFAFFLCYNSNKIDRKGENAMLGMRIAFLRIGKGWSREELAQRVGCSARTVYMCERGRQKPSSDMLLRLAEEFGMTTDYLLTGETQQFDSSEMLEEPHITVRIEALIQYLSTTSE